MSVDTVTPAASGALSAAVRHNLTRLMAEKKITRPQLLARTGLTSGMLSFLINGKRAGSLATIEMIAVQGLGVQPHLLFTPPSADPCTNCKGRPRPGWICAYCGTGSQPVPLLRSA